MKKVFGLFLVCGLIACGFHPLGAQQVYTGLVIDASTLPFNPSASPKILDEDGREIYGSAFLDKQWVEKQGVVGYAKSVDEAKASGRVAQNPFVVKAIKVGGPNNGELTVAQEDARKIRDLAKSLNFLDRAKVIIIVP
jgi:hypothetical protein